MIDDVSEVLKQFPVTVKGVRLLSWKGKKGNWAVQTERGLKVLKKCAASSGRQLFLCRAVLHLRANGAPIPDLVQTRDGAPFAERNGVCYTLSDAVEGRSPEYEVPSDLREIMETMGRFHLASRGFTFTDNGEERKHLGKWEEGYEQHLSKLEAFKEEAARRSDAFSKRYLQYADRMIARGRQALGILRSGGYRAWVNKVEQQRNLCHQDFASGNLIRSSEGLYIIDMDGLTFDLPARDLRKILNKVTRNKGWRVVQTVAVLKGYHSKHPLSVNEYGVLKADLLFPHLFCGISDKYYNRYAQTDWSLGSPIDRLGLTIRLELSKMNVLRRWDNLVRRVTAGKGGEL
jgi:CotS family spore coat protein